MRSVCGILPKILHNVRGIISPNRDFQTTFSLGFGVLRDSSVILLPCASLSFLEYSRVVSINLEVQDDPGRSSGGPSPHNIHARGIRGASPRVSSFDRLELHLIRAFRRARSDR